MSQIRKVWTRAATAPASKLACPSSLSSSEFIADFNSRFGKSPRNPKDMHRPLADHEKLDGHV
jgi:hypothetical protein